MQKLIEKVAADAEISAEQSKKAIESVSQYIKAATPGFFHQQLDVLLNGGTFTDAMKVKLSDLQNDVEEATKEFGRKAEELAKDVSRKVNDIFKK